MANFATTDEAIAAIKGHPLCDTFMETPNTWVVFYPATYVIPGGASLPKGIDQLSSLCMLYDRVDQFWQAQRLQVPAQ